MRRTWHAFDLGLLALSAAFIAMALFVRSSDDAGAWHYRGKALWSMQTNSYSEQFCVEDNGSTYSLATLYSYVGNTLYNDNTSQDWDALGLTGGYYNVYWYSAGPTACTSHPYRSDIEVEYWASPSGCGGGFSCADHDVYDSTWDGHQLFWYGYVTLHDDHLSPTSLRRHVINHETGHILGLADPDVPDIGDFDDYPDEDATLCEDYYSTTNGEDSVMHSDHYCGDGNESWPSTDGDIWCVERIAWQISVSCWY